MAATLHDIHVASAGSMGTFWHREFPALYSTLEKEFAASQEGAALADLSCFGKIVMRGKDALDLLHRLSTNELLSLRRGQVRTTLLCTDKGRLVDLLEVWNRGDSLLVRCSPETEEAVRHWIGKYTITEEVELESVTSQVAEALLIGPLVDSLMTTVIGARPQEWAFQSVALAGDQVLVGRVLHMRMPMIRILGPNAAVAELWKKITDYGRGKGVREMGMAAYEALRISLGIPMISHEITEAFTPYEAGLKNAISFTKGCYIGQEVIARLDTYQKVRRRLIGLVLSAAPSGEAGRVPLIKAEKEVGWLTSALGAGVRGKFIGLGIVSDRDVREGDSVEIRMPAGTLHGVAINLPILL